MTETLPNLPPRAGHWPCTNEEYHADNACLSHSALEVFRASMARYAAQYVHQTIPPLATTDAMLVGSALHMAVLEPELYDTMLAIAPDGDKRSNASKLAFAEFETQNAGKLILSTQDALNVRNMAQAIQQHPIAASLLAKSGPVEHSVCWTDAVTQIRCKARMDKFIPHDSGATIIDIKTTTDASPEAWHRSALNYGYHRQAAFYRRALRELDISHNPTFLFIVVSKNAPHEVWVYLLDDDHYDVAEVDIDLLLNELKMCREMNEWHARFTSNIVTLKLPHWAAKDRVLPKG